MYSTISILFIALVTPLIQDLIFSSLLCCLLKICLLILRTLNNPAFDSRRHYLSPPWMFTVQTSLKIVQNSLGPLNNDLPEAWLLVQYGTQRAQHLLSGFPGMLDAF